MKTYQAGTISGCIFWLISFLIMASCLLPVGLVAGSLTTTTNASFITRILEPYLCPEGSQARVHTYATTTLDENGFEKDSTAYEMRCLNPQGEIIKDLGATYGFIWMGILAAISVVLSALLAILLAAPVGILVARYIKRSPKTP